MDSNLKQCLKNCLKAPLPGREAQYHMAPNGREDEASGSADQDRVRHSSVLILFYMKEQSPGIILIKRPNYRGVHGGQVSFPGGKMEKQDKSLQDTALRETHEEVGIPPGKVEILGTLTSLYIPPSNYWVYPYVGYCDPLPAMKPDPGEVEMVIEADFRELMNHEMHKKGTVRASGNRTLTAPYFLINGYVVWGATAMILNELKVLLASFNGQKM